MYYMNLLDCFVHILDILYVMFCDDFILDLLVFYIVQVLDLLSYNNFTVKKSLTRYLSFVRDSIRVDKIKTLFNCSNEILNTPFTLLELVLFSITFSTWFNLLSVTDYCFN